MNNSPNCSSDPAWPKEIQTSLTLEVRGMGSPISFKNSKAISRNRKTGKPFVRTKDEYRAWMDRVTLALESQLRSIARAIEEKTATDAEVRFWTVWSPHFTTLDDSIQWFQKIVIEGILNVPHGCDGFTVTIETI